MLVEDLKQQLTKAEKELQQAAKFGHDLLLQNKALKAQISKPLLDPKLASEIESLLTSQVRNLTAKVRESEQSRIEISETLTLEIKNLETIIEKRNNIESKLNERIWELEVENQNQKENLTSLNDQVLKLKQESRNAGLRNVSLTSQVEVLKSTEADLRVMISSLQNQVDQARKMSSRKSSIVSAAVSEQEKMFKNIPLIDVESANKALIEQLQFEIEELNQETIELTNIKQQQFDEISELKRILEESQETIEMLKQEEQNHIPDILPLDRQLVSTPFEDDHLDDLYKQVDNPFRNENLEARKSQFLELLKQPNSRPASPQVSLSAPELATQSTGNLDFPDEAIIKKSAVSKINQPRPIYSISPSRSQIQLTRSTTKRKDDVFQPASSLNSSTSTLNKKPLRRMQSFISSHLSRDADSSDDESQVIHGEYHEPESKFDMLPIEALTFTMVGSWVICN